MAATEVSICNIGLSFINVPALTALTDSSKAGRTCNLNYEPKRDELLRGFEWKFATKRDQLTVLVPTPEFEWSYQFTYPVDCLKLLYVGDAYGYKYPYSLENNLILCNYDDIYVKYTEQITDPTAMDPLFRAALSMYIAQHVASALAMKGDYKRAVDEYEVKLADARFAGSIEDDADEMETNDWIESRY